MIVISSSLVLSGEEISGNNPRIGWHNIVTATNVSADEEAADHPASNLGNPATYLTWKGTSTSEQTVAITLGAAKDVDYFGIARHNLGSTRATVAFEYSADGVEWTTVESVEPASDHALIVEFDAVNAQFFRLKITPGSAAPEIAVLYIGQILRLQRRIYVGHTPIVYGRQSTVSNGFSESGQFLGRVLRRQMFRSSVSMQNITPGWYRSKLEPFADAAAVTPFFFAWRPQTYPNEVGFAWVMGDVSMSNQRPNGMVQFEFQMQGIR